MVPCFPLCFSHSCSLIVSHCMSHNRAGVRVTKRAGEFLPLRLVAWPTLDGRSALSQKMGSPTLFTGGLFLPLTFTFYWKYWRLFERTTFEVTSIISSISPTPISTQTLWLSQNVPCFLGLQTPGDNKVLTLLGLLCLLLYSFSFSLTHFRIDPEHLVKFLVFYSLIYMRQLKKKKRVFRKTKRTLVESKIRQEEIDFTKPFISSNDERKYFQSWNEKMMP